MKMVGEESRKEVSSTRAILGWSLAKVLIRNSQ